MLTANETSTAERTPAVATRERHVTSVASEPTSRESVTAATPSWVEKVLRIEWLGQTVASICWIVSVFTYGISSTGDWLQLAAASSWLVANLAAVVTIKAD